MKKILLILLAVSSLVYVSCDNDDNDYNWNNYLMSVGTVTKTVDSLYITTDKGNVLNPVYSSVNTSLLKDNMRVLVDFRIHRVADESQFYDYYIDIYDISPMLTKPVFEFDSETSKEVKDSIGNDMVTISDSWCDNDYINMVFKYKGGSKSHYINLVYDSTEATTLGGEIILELKHNNRNDQANRSLWGIASFDVSKFKEDGKKSIDFLIRTKGKDDKYEYNEIITYSFDENDDDLYNDLWLREKNIETQGLQ